MSYQALVDEQGRRTGILAFVVDVTAGMLAQQRAAALQADGLAAAQREAVVALGGKMCGQQRDDLSPSRGLGQEADNGKLTRPQLGKLTRGDPRIMTECAALQAQEQPEQHDLVWRQQPQRPVCVRLNR